MNKVLKIILIVLAFLITFSSIYSQPVTWMRYYDPTGGSRDFGRDVIQTFDGGFIIAGNTNSSIALIKIDYKGIIEWQRSISNSSVSSIIQTSDSGFALIGESHYLTIMKLIRTNKYGDTLWSRLYTRNGRQSRAWSGKMTADKGFIMCGEIHPDSPNEVYLVKTDSLGNLQWDRQYNGYSASDVTLDSSHFYLLSSSLRKLDLLGNEKWIVPIGIASKISQSNDGFLYVAGGQGQFYFAKIDTSGKIIFQRNYFSLAYGHGLCFDINGNPIIAGGIQTDTGTSKSNIDILLARFDTSGNFKNSKVISLGKVPGGLPSQESITNVYLTNDKGFIMCGTTTFPTGIDIDENILCIKTDSLFNSTQLIGINNLSTTIKKDYELFQNYPNPFNSTTVIKYILSTKSNVKLNLYDVTGKFLKSIVNETQSPGEYKVLFDGSLFSTGVYFMNLRAENYSSIKKFLLIK